MPSLPSKLLWGPLFLGTLLRIGLMDDCLLGWSVVRSGEFSSLEEIALRLFNVEARIFCADCRCPRVFVDVGWGKGAVDADESNSGQKRTAPQHGLK